LDERELRALALACQRGEAQAFRELVESLTRTLIAQAFRYTRDWEWARDLFRAWLYAVHRNGCLSHVRKSWVKRELTPGDDEVRGAVEVMSEAADPEEDLERREFHRRLLTAMERLSESQRQVFVRVDVEQQEPKKVAQELGIKNGTLRATLHFARKRLAAVLRETEEFS
jgi:RNA polymerase sigma-70 factor (ECF subfamily)